MASLYLMSFLIKGGSKGGKMQISIYKGQEMGEKKPESSYQDLNGMPRKAECSMRLHLWKNEI